MKNYAVFTTNRKQECLLFGSIMKLLTQGVILPLQSDVLFLCDNNTRYSLFLSELD